MVGIAHPVAKQKQQHANYNKGTGVYICIYFPKMVKPNQSFAQTHSLQERKKKQCLPRSFKIIDNYLSNLHPLSYESSHRYANKKINK
jgi:hypothetical protein